MVHIGPLLVQRLHRRGVIGAAVATLTLSGLVATAPGLAVPAVAAPKAAAPAGSYVPVPQVRLLDTRSTTALSAGATRTLPIAGHNGLPSTGVGTVVLTVVALDHTGAGYLTVYADGTTRPSIPSVTFGAGYSRANQVLAQPGSDGGVTIYNGSTASTDVVVDVSGYFVGGTGSAAGSYRPVPPTRLLNTGRTAEFKGNESRRVQVAGLAGVPVQVSAVVFEVGVVSPTGGGHALLSGPPEVQNSSVTGLTYFVAGQSVSSLTVRPLDPEGQVTLTNASTGTTPMTLDVVGYFVTGEPSTAGQFGTLIATRTAINTVYSGTGPIPGHGSVDVSVAGTPGVPPDATAVALNIVVTRATASGYITTYPTGSARPNAVNLNFTSGRNMSNQAVVQIGAGGQITFYNGSTKPVDIMVSMPGFVGAVPGPLRWTSPHQVQTDSNLGPLLSCASASFCLELDKAGQYTTYDGTKWTTSANLDVDALALAVSCPSNGFCLAVTWHQEYESESTTIGAEIYRNGKWTPTPAVPSVGDSDMPGAVSCASASYCVATGGGGPTGPAGGRTWIFNGSTWSQNIDASLGYGGAPSCIPSKLCLSTDGNNLLRLVGTRWVSTTTDISDLDMVSCAAGPFCLIGSNEQTEAGNGTTWQKPVSIGSTDASDSLNDLSCAAATFCAGLFGNGAVDTASVGFYTAGRWSTQPDRAFSEPLIAISCPTVNFCAATDASGNVILGTRA